MQKARTKTQKSANAKRNPRAIALEPNLIITIDERHRRLANVEIKQIMGHVSPGARITGRPGEGLVGVFVSGDPRACIRTLRSLFSQNPFPFQHTHRWLPIEEWVKANAREVARFARHATAEIAAGESWKIQAERHGSRVDRVTLVTALARDIDNRNVDLKTPDKTVLLEIIGRRAGMAVVHGGQTLSVDAEMKRQFVEFEEVP